MKYRCPYCKGIIEKLRAPKCPHCGRYMAINIPLLDKETARELGEKHRHRHRMLERIHKQYERQKQELSGALSPSVFRTPSFYLGVMFVMAIAGALLFNAVDNSVAAKRETRYQRAMRHVDILAEALGRYHFHVGHYPSDEQGLAALVRDPGEPRWNGPYISHLRADPWDTPFVYQWRSGAPPLLLSAGTDRQVGTDDDIAPDLQRFDPGTAWTNGWVSAEKRLPGVTILKHDPTTSAAD